MKEKILATEVLAILKEGNTTRRKIAQRLGCSEVTISKKVSVLISRGENIGFNHKGLFLYTKEDMQDSIDADSNFKWGQRIINSLTQWARRGNNTKPILIAARRQFGKELTQDERKQLRSNLLMITRVVDAVDLDEELGA